MSGIYISGMEMPRSCEDCMMFCSVAETEMYFGARPPKCPLIPVPDHGDLIDRDEMRKQFVEQLRKDYRYECSDASFLIDHAQTVIPADKGGDVE